MNVRIEEEQRFTMKHLIIVKWPVSLQLLDGDFVEDAKQSSDNIHCQQPNNP